MKKEDVLNFEVGGSEDFDLQVEKDLKYYSGLFLQKVSERARGLGLINTGAMISDDNFKAEVSGDDSRAELDMYMIYYADFVNKGVKGVKSSNNAPESPYKYKNLGMSEEGRKSILRSVEQGKIKVSDTSKTKYGLQGLENKAQKTPNQKEINEKEAARIAYLIKAYGIKTTNFINDSWNDWVKEIGPDLPKIIAPKIFAQLIKVK